MSQILSRPENGCSVLRKSKNNIWNWAVVTSRDGWFRTLVWEERLGIRQDFCSQISM